VFLDRLVRKGLDLKYLRKNFKDYMESALKRDWRALAAARAEWGWFKYVFYTRQGRPVPDWPVYNEIEVELGLRGKKDYEKSRLRAKRRIYEHLETILQRICCKCPGWRWAKKEHCYLKAALSDSYMLQDGTYSCYSHVS